MDTLMGCILPSVQNRSKLYIEHVSLLLFYPVFRIMLPSNYLPLYYTRFKEFTIESIVVLGCFYHVCIRENYPC
jgi:hypothetical protein